MLLGCWELAGSRASADQGGVLVVGALLSLGRRLSSLANNLGTGRWCLRGSARFWGKRLRMWKATTGAPHHLRQTDS